MNIRFFVIGIITGISTSLHAQFIAEVLEYKPAPGQFINENPWGTPSAVNSLIGGVNGNLTLGGFGGYLVFKFEHPVGNDPDNPYGVDFTIFGNASQYSSEPGIVYVMNDENSNLLPDDTWYQLAGSDYFFSTTKTDYQITYINPQMHANVPWYDNYGHTGNVQSNDFHTHNYYPDVDSFPAIAKTEYTLGGTLIAHVIDSSNTSFVSTFNKAFGYVDNFSRGMAPFTIPDNPYTPEKENSGGDAFDISWAVDEDGNYVNLDHIDFVKVQTAVNGNAGWLGELSTEITGAVDVAADASLSGKQDVFVVKKFPPVIYKNSWPLEAAYFINGYYQKNEPLSFTVTKGFATIDDNNTLHISASGEIIIEARLSEHPDIKDTISTFAEITTEILKEKSNAKLAVWPNPAHDFIRIRNNNSETFLLLNRIGQVITEHTNCPDKISVAHLSPGIYFLQSKSTTLKFVKE